MLNLEAWTRSVSAVSTTTSSPAPTRSRNPLTAVARIPFGWQVLIGLVLDLQDPATTTYVAAGAVAAWPDVSAVRITFTVNSDSAVGTGNVPLSRDLEYVVTLRSRAQ